MTDDTHDTAEVSSDDCTGGNERFTFYYGAASGGSQKALRKLGEKNVMLSYATKNNRPWAGIENLFVDCGAYSMLKAGKEHGPIEDYLTYLRSWQPAKFALRDYPCEPDLLQDLGRSVGEHQRLTLEDHIGMLDNMNGIMGQPYTVLQGWELNDYLRCIELFEDHGVPLDHVAVGSVCRRNAVDEILEVLSAVRYHLPDATIHAFGVKTQILQHPEVFEWIDSADSVSFDYRSMMEHHTGYWKYLALEYLKMWDAIETAIADGTQKKMSATDGGETAALSAADSERGGDVGE